MDNVLSFVRLVLLLTFALVGCVGAQHALRNVSFSRVRVTDGFWSRRIETNRRVTIEANLRHCATTGRIRNFAAAGGLVKSAHEGQLYNDSDVYKVLEGIAYALGTQRDAGLERRADAIIDRIAAAQRDDGYLNTFVTLVKPHQRWKNLRYGHELYCAGHLIEAAIAYRHATGKRKLLDVAIRLADHIRREFGVGKRSDPPGHQEIELALVKLGRETGNPAYRALARFFLDRRGQADRVHFGAYCQDDEPVSDQRQVRGHAVRAMYQLCAMADLAAGPDGSQLRAALDAVWHDVVDRKMYVTGGIGDSASNEGFTGPYVLPNDTAYAETCAAIGMALWNHRMFLLTGDGRYMDIVEREIYNGLIAGVSVSGDKFFYSNVLGSRGGVGRVPWFGCSCCPTNLVRYVPAIGERVFAYRDDVIYVGLYMGASAEIPLSSGNVKLTMTTPYPWDGVVRLRVDLDEPRAFALKLRRPGWCRGPVRVVGVACDKAVERGFYTIRRTWKPGQTFSLELPMPVRRVRANPLVAADAGRVALMRGPVVYCLEAIDHGGSVRNLVLPPEAKLEASYDATFLGGATILHGTAVARTSASAGGSAVATRPVRLRAIPYHLWANRGDGAMVVWIPETPELAELPGEGRSILDGGVLHGGVRISSSHCYAGDSLIALHDGKLPKTSGDATVPRMTWWPRRGNAGSESYPEWIQYAFPAPRTLSAVELYWFDDSGRGACRVPKDWRLRYRDQGAWLPVHPLAGQRYGMRRDRFNELRFEPVRARALRLEVRLRDGKSAGVLEWRVR